jgi:streptogramin lyase
MKKLISLSLLLVAIGVAGQDSFRDGVMIESDDPCPVPTSARVFTVVDSFTGPFGYSGGLAYDGRYVWNLDIWSPPCSIARIDPVTHAVVTMFAPTYGDRDMAFDGQYLWVSHWQTNSIYKYDTSTFALMASYDPPFAGHAHGMAWDGAYLWVGEESGRIYKMNTIGDTIRSIPFNAPYPSDPRGLGFSTDGHLWVGHQGYGRVYEIDTISGTILNWYPAPGYVSGWNFQQGVDFGGGFLWTTTGGTYNKIYKIDIGQVEVEEHTQKDASRLDLNVTPNPCMNNAVISFALAEPMTVTLSILDASGRIIATVFDEQDLASGDYRYRLPGGLNKSGVYFIILRTKSTTEAVKLIRL